MSRGIGATEDERVWKPLTPTVPETWTQVDFEQAFDTVSVNNKKVPAKTYLSEGLFPVIDQGQAFIGGYTNDSTKAIDPGEDGLIVFGDHTRIFKRVTFPFAPGADGTKILRPTLSSSAYAYYACLSLQFPNKGYSRHYSYLCKCKFPVAPKPEQTRIVSKIDELFSEIEEGERALERVQKLVKRYRQSVLKAAVTGELTREWREKHKGKLESGEGLLRRILKARREGWEEAEREKMAVRGRNSVSDTWKSKYREPSPADIADLPNLPKGWVWVRLEQLGFVESGSTPPSIEEKLNDAGSIPWFKVSSMNEKGNEVSLARSRWNLTPAAARQCRLKILPVGTVVFPKRGGAIHTNKKRVLGVPGALDLNLMGFVPIDGLFGYVRLLFDRLDLNTIFDGSNVPQINYADVADIRVPLPGAHECEAIASGVASQVSAINALAYEAARHLNQASALRQKILSAAFSGSLVEQDPDDESASAILARAAAARSDGRDASRRRNRTNKGIETA